MKIALHVIGMFLMGLLTLIAFAALVETRIGHPLYTASADGASVSGAPVAGLRQGIASDIEIVVGAIGEERSVATHALDAAMRAARLGADVFGEPFHAVHETITAARVALQNGDPDEARRLLRAVRMPSDGADTPVETPADLHRYAGAQIIAPNGVRIGEVRAIEEREGRARVQLVLGGVRDALGFIDIGGETRWVEQAQLLYGKPRSIGNTLVSQKNMCREPC